MKSLIPVVMAGILGIYGMIVAVILCQKSNIIIISVKKGEYAYFDGYKHMASGLVCGFSCVVLILLNLRLLDTLSELWGMQV
jgi:V-type H+-transporting ATPase proteolipid subunit